MVRLPNAKSPTFQTHFRRLREQLPKLFSSDEHRRYIRLLHGLYRQALVMASNHGPGGARCNSDICDAAPHGSCQFYEEFAEALMGRVFLWAHRPDELKRELVYFLQKYDHVVEARLNPVRLGETVERSVQRDSWERERVRLV